MVENRAEIATKPAGNAPAPAGRARQRCPRGLRCAERARRPLPMPRLVKWVRVILVADGTCAAALFPAANAAEGAPTGAWRAANDCFLAGFVLNTDGSVQAAYL